MSKFTIEIASVPDKEKLVAEIWYDKTLVAEINQENKLVIELFLISQVAFDLNDFFQALVTAKNRLV